jgi:hypothetical protein
VSLNQENTVGIGSVAHAVQHLLCKHKDLSSNSSPTKERKYGWMDGWKEGRKERREGGKEGQREGGKEEGRKRGNKTQWSNK